MNSVVSANVAPRKVLTICICVIYFDGDWILLRCIFSIILMMYIWIIFGCRFDRLYFGSHILMMTDYFWYNFYEVYLD